MNDIDKLGALNAQIADLQEQARAIKDRLIADIGPGYSADGDFYRVSVSEQVRVTLDQDDVRRFLHPNQLRVCQRESTITVVRCVARKAAAVRRVA